MKSRNLVATSIASLIAISSVLGCSPQSRSSPGDFQGSSKTVRADSDDDSDGVAISNLKKLIQKSIPDFAVEVTGKIVNLAQRLSLLEKKGIDTRTILLKAAAETSQIADDVKRSNEFADAAEDLLDELVKKVESHEDELRRLKEATGALKTKDAEHDAALEELRKALTESRAQIEEVEASTQAGREEGQKVIADLNTKVEELARKLAELNGGAGPLDRTLLTANPGEIPPEANVFCEVEYFTFGTFEGPTRIVATSVWVTSRLEGDNKPYLASAVVEWHGRYFAIRNKRANE